MKVTVRTLRMGWSAVIDVPDKCLVGELRQEAAKAAGMPAARTKLVLRGAALQVRESREGSAYFGLKKQKEGAHLYTWGVGGLPFVESYNRYPSPLATQLKLLRPPNLT